MSSRTGSSATTNKLNTQNILKTEGILNNDEEFETVYLNEDEIEKFMERYLAENPGAEIETRYVKPPPVQLVQDIHVRWLRPPTPEMPPIIIREVGVQYKELPPLRIVEKPKKSEELEPIVIRERPPPPPIEAPTIAYVQNVIKHEIKRPPAQQSQVGSLSQKESLSLRSQEIPIEHVSSKNLPNFTSGEHKSFIETNLSQQLDADDNELVKIEENLIRKLEEKKRRLSIEEKLRQNNSNNNNDNNIINQTNKSYSEKFVSSAKVFETSLNEPTQIIIQPATNNGIKSEDYLKEEEHHKSQLFTRSENLNTSASISSKLKSSQSFKTTTASSVITNVTRNSNGIGSSSSTLSSLTKPKSDTSTYKNIKFTKVTDPEELNRFNAIFENPNTPCIKSKHEGDRIMSTFEASAASANVDKSSLTNNISSNSKTNSVNIIKQNSNKNTNVNSTDIVVTEASKSLLVKETNNINIQNLARLSVNSNLHNCAENFKGPVTSTSHENANSNRKNSDILLIDALNERESDSNPRTIGPSITREHIIKKNNQVYRYRHVEDLRIVAKPAKTEQNIAGQNYLNNQANLHPHKNNNNHNHHHHHSHSHHNPATPSRISSQHSNRLQSQQSQHSRNSSYLNNSQNNLKNHHSSRAHSKLT